MIQKRILTTIRSNFSVIITAAGSSTRIGGCIKKEYLSYKNGTVLSSCVKEFIDAFNSLKMQIHSLIITYPQNKLDDCKKAIECDLELIKKLKSTNLTIEYIEGSLTRQSSVYNAISFINKNPSDYVLIHDGARPFISTKLICDVITATIQNQACTPGITPTDTIKQIDSEGFITNHLIRNNLSCVQTPQGFNFSQLFSAHNQAIKDKIEYTDDTQIFGAYCGKVKVIDGDIKNIKITYPKDLELVK